jgi:hypothetical protein
MEAENSSETLKFSLTARCYIPTNWLHGAEPFLRSRQICSYLRASQNFTETEGLLPRSQDPYRQPNRSSPYHFILSILILSAHLRLGLPSGLLPCSFPTNIPLWYFVISLLFTVRSCYPHAQHSSWRTTPCRLSGIFYLLYSQFSSISGGRVLHPQPEDAP